MVQLVVGFMTVFEQQVPWRETSEAIDFGPDGAS